MSDLDKQRGRRPGNRDRIDRIKDEMDQDVLRTRIATIVTRMNNQPCCDDPIHDGQPSDWALEVANAVIEAVQTHGNPSVDNGLNDGDCVHDDE